jgi:hypothetical protein
MITKSLVFAATLVCLSYLSMVGAFVPVSSVSSKLTRTMPEIYMGAFDGDQDRKSLTRDSEPEDYFKT